MTSVEIIFVGLCTFLNLEDARPDMPPPSVILHRDGHHIPFIGFHKDVSMSGTSAIPTKGDYSLIPLDGVELLLNDEWSKKPTLGTNMDKLASVLKYAGVTTKNWNRNRVPRPGDLPDPSEVSAYLQFGGGELEGKRVSSIEWEFLDSNGDPSPVQAKEKRYTFARAVKYSFNVSGDSLVVKIRGLAGGGGTRELTFKSKTNPIRIYIGNSMDPLKEIGGKEPSMPGASPHFATFYKVVTGNPPVHIPHPKGIVAKGVETGYCGPDKEP